MKLRDRLLAIWNGPKTMQVHGSKLDDLLRRMKEAEKELSMQGDIPSKYLMKLLEEVPTTEEERRQWAAGE